jgi:BON domain
MIQDRDNALKAMIIMRKLLVTAAVAGAAVGAKLGIDKLRQSGQAESTVADLRRRGRHLAGQAKGVAYHTLRRHPDANVDDSTLADRVRSSIGPLEKRLHVPRVHVTVENGTVILHGEVHDSEAEAEIVKAVDGIAGVRDVRSHLTPT